MSTKKRLVCAGCGAVNQFLAERLAEGPVCARCKRPLVAGEVIDVDGASLARHIANSDFPVLVDFWAPWCGPCVQFAPVYSALAQQRPDIRCLKLDTQANGPAAAQWGIQSIPTLMLFTAGKVVARQSGALPPAQLNQWLTGALAQVAG